MEAPLKFHVWIGLTVLAGAVRRNVYMDRGYFKTFPNIYTGVIGPTGDGKTTAGDVGMGILNEVPDIDIIQEKATSWYILELFDHLVRNKKSCTITIYAPEMKTFLSDLNKTDLVTLLTSLFTCPDERDYRRKGSAKVGTGGQILKLKNVCINLLACSTPEWLTTGTSTDDIHGGFTGRFVYAYEDITDRSSPFPEDFMSAHIKQLRFDLVEDLKHIAQLSGTFVLTDQAKADYIVWYNKRKEECKDERLIGYYARKRELVFKVAMLLSISKDDSLVIDEKILNTAWKLLERAELKMGDAFSGVVDDPGLRFKDHVLAEIARSPNQRVTRSHLLRKFWTKFDGIVLDRIMQNLIDARLVQQIGIREGNETLPGYMLRPDKRKAS